LFRREASLAYPLPNPTTTDFILSPLLTLPESFQSAFVGEVFSCTLSANNELPHDEAARSVHGVRIGAEIISPSNPSGTVLELETPPTQDTDAKFGPGDSYQRILRLNLQDEGDHTLAVTVTYTETTVSNEGKAAGGKVRTFRKLYQFSTAQLLSVRTKACDVREGVYVLEAQLENMGDHSIVLETARMNPKSPFEARSLNWDMPGIDPKDSNPPILNPRDIHQIAFLLEGESTEDVPVSAKNPEKRFIVGQINVQWRSAMGDRGSINTGWLTAKKR
jgi:hypothetical protein